MTNLDHIFKKQRYHFAYKRPYRMLWPFQSHTDVRIGPSRRLRAKELMLWNYGAGEDLRVPWTATKSNQSILQEINPECSLERLMLKLKLQYFGYHWKTP